MSLPRITLPEAGAGLGFGALFGLLMGGPSSAGIGAMAGLAFAAASAQRDRKARGKPAPLTDHRARNRRRLFLRGLCSVKVDQVERLATDFRRIGALTAARALKQHALDLQAVEAKTVDDAALERFTEIVTLAREQFPDDSPQVQAAQANLDAARAARPEPEP